MEKHGWIIPAATLFVLVVLGLYDGETISQIMRINGSMAMESNTNTTFDLLFFSVPTLLALSGWGTLIYQHFSTIPKIKGSIFNIIQSQIHFDGSAPGDYLCLVTYVYLINKRKSPVHMLDYKLEMKIKGQWIKLKRVYGVHLKNFKFNVEDGKEITIPEFNKDLIYRKNKPVEFGKPLHGWLIFFGDSELHGVWPEEYRLTCIDAFNKKHKFVTRPKDFASIYLFQDLAGIEIPN